MTTWCVHTALGGLLVGYLQWHFHIVVPQVVGGAAVGALEVAHLAQARSVHWDLWLLVHTQLQRGLGGQPYNTTCG